MPALTLIGYWRNPTHPEYPDPRDFVDESWDSEERAAVAGYLRSGSRGWYALGYSNCRMCGCVNGSAELTDWTYVWPEGLGHYVDAHSVRLPRRVVEHILSRVAEFESRRAIDASWWLTARPDHERLKGAMDNARGLSQSARVTTTVPDSMLVLTLDGQRQEWTLRLDEIQAHQSYVLSLRAPDGREWSSGGHGVWDCLMRLRRRLEPLGYRLCCNGSRRGVWTSGLLSQMSAGYDVYVLDEWVEGQSPPVVRALDTTSPELVVSIDEQREWFAAASGFALATVPYGPSEVMVSRARARELADEFARATNRRLTSTLTELTRGWYFAFESGGSIGSHGFAVDKETGRVFVFGSAFPVERDLRMYDEGMNADRHHLVILEVADLTKTLSMLKLLAPTVIEPSHEHGTVWRIPRCLTDDEIKARLATLPAIFPDLPLYFHFEAVVEAWSSRFCTLEVLPVIQQGATGHTL